MSQNTRSGDSAGQAAARQSSTESYWRLFPAMERLLGQEQPRLLGQMEATCRQLDAIAKAGSPQEQARARDAMTAYTRALQLYRDLVARRDQAFAEASNREGVSHDKSGRGEH